MPDPSLADALQSADSPLEHLRTVRNPPHPFPRVPSEHTNWIEEQRAWREACSLADQSHHMTDLVVEGPGAGRVFADLGINDFTDFPVGRAKQFVACSPAGYLVGDGILFHLAPDRYALVGEAPAPNWVQYHLETGDYDATFSRDDDSGVRDGPPERFRYQLQGPNALDVVEAVVDGSVPDVDFFGFVELEIDGRPVSALRHGMAGEPGFEVWGDWIHGDAVRDALRAAGQDRGLRELGWKSYGTSGVMSGWLGNPLPAVYTGEALSAYRAWLAADGYEARYLLGGSYRADDVTDYYLRPHTLGYDRLLAFDHDFVGRDALETLDPAEARRKVTLVWNDEDVVSAFGSLFSPGETAKHMRLPMPAWANQYDAVRRDGDVVGLSASPVYSYNERMVASLGLLEPDHAEPGTEVVVTWGEEDADNVRVERHEERPVRAIVAPAPYTADNR